MSADFATWLFASPRRLVVVALTVIILVFVGGSALFGNDPPAGDDVDSGSVTVGSTNAAVPDAGEYVAAAVEFVQLWARPEPGQTQEQWRARLTPLATPDYARALATTDTSALPGVQPDGDPVVRFLAQESAMIAVPLAGGDSVLVTVVTGEGTSEPKVSDVQPNTGD